MLESLIRPNDTDERCGLILKGRKKPVEIKNIAHEKTLGFEMDPAALLKYIETGKVVATWHTHPGNPPILSGEDYKGFLAWPDLEHYIIGQESGQISVTKYRVEGRSVILCD